MQQPPGQPLPPYRAPQGTEPSLGFQIGRGALLTCRFLGYLVLVYIAIVQAILVIGFFLQLFGANPSTPFVEFIYRSLDRIMAPFRAIFSSVELGTAPNDVPAVLDTSLLFAMIIYGLFFLVLQAILRWFTYRIERLETQQLRDQQRAERQAGVEHAAAPYSGEPR